MSSIMCQIFNPLSYEFPETRGETMDFPNIGIVKLKLIIECRTDH